MDQKSKSPRRPELFCPDDRTLLVKREDTWEFLCLYCQSRFWQRPHGALELLVRG